ncbi:MAG: EAL domain-containing protein [Pseudomonadota bacterium]
MQSLIKIIHLEDGIEDAELLLREIGRGGLNVNYLRVDTGAQFLDAIRQTGPDLILSDYSIPGFDGMTALDMARKHCPEIPFLFVSGTIGEERAIEALKKGASDYVIKGMRGKLVPAIIRALSNTQERRVRQRTERELKASEMRFRLFMDQLPDAVYMKDQAGRFTYVNRGAEQIIGRPTEQIIGHTVSDIYPLKHAGEYQQNDIDALANEAGIEVTEEALMQDGMHYFRGRKFPIRSLDGETNLLGGISQDITSRVRAEHALQLSEQRFRSLADATHDWIWEVDLQGRYTYSNGASESILGYTPAQMLVSTADQYLHHETREPALGLVRKCLAHRRGWTNLTGCWQHRDGSRRWMESTALPLRDAAQQIVGYRGVNRDVTERMQQQDRMLRLSRLHAVLSGINAAILRINDKHRLMDEICSIAVETGQVSAALIAMVDLISLQLIPVASTGFDKTYLAQHFDHSADPTLPNGQGIIGMALNSRRRVISGDLSNDPRFTPEWRAKATKLGFRSVFVAPLIVAEQPIGVVMMFSTQVQGFNDEEQKLLVDVAADISYALDYFDKQAQLNYLAYFDNLTGLPNRSLFQDRLGQLIAREAGRGKGQTAIVMIDMERFRNVNDTLGRSSGDELLREVTKRLLESVPDAGFLARISADCFAFVIKGCTSDQDVTHLLENKLTPALLAPMQLLDKHISISIKAGIALFPADGNSVDSLLRNAEVALKNAKSANTRALFYTPAMNARAAETLSVENRLRRALEDDQFLLYYQPKFDLASGQLTGLEALIRWQEPGVGLVLPGKFIYVLEETGLIVEVGRWVIQRAHRQYQQWLARGFAPPRIAVNVSQLQIRRPEFVDDVLEVLSSAAPAEIEIEITESLFMADGDKNLAKDKLATLRETGITIAIDDFGTGYSSLSYIAHLPIDTLKIDRSFIIDMATSAQNMAIVKTIISLAHSLTLKVVAEGVETEQQATLLRQLGCDQVQGFVFSRPLPADAIEPLLTRQAALPQIARV